ncbi:MAG: hypothetical protein C0417_12320 [Chlorobiaceae bacterium]|nr:hypothetical protein [Chlorobiaceae bacterium]
MTFEKSYINAKFDSLLDERIYREEVKKGQNNVPRSLAATAIVFAFFSRTDKSTKHNQRAQYLIEETLKKYPLWTSSLLPHEESFNLAPTTAYNIGLASWLLWDSLNRETQGKVKEMLIRESNYQLLRNPASGYEKDTKAEENSIVPALLVMTSQFFPEEQKAKLWEDKARCFAYHTITVNSDSAYCGLKTITAYENFNMDNHNFGPHPLYMAAPLVHFADAALVYKAAGKNVPLEFCHNVLPLWERLKSFLKQDYSWSANSSWHPTGLSREISGATFMSIIMNVDWEIENSLLSYKVKNQKYFVEKKVDVVNRQQYYDTDWFNNCIVAKRYVVSWLLHNPKILPKTPLMIN